MTTQTTKFKYLFPGQEFFYKGKTYKKENNTEGSTATNPGFRRVEDFSPNAEVELILKTKIKNGK